MSTISILIPTLDRPNDLERALRSIASNTVWPDEVVIVEQGNIDRTRAVIGIVNAPFRISVYHLWEKSLARARNLGIKQTKGDIVLFIDDDVELEHGFIEELTTYMNIHASVLGVTGIDLVRCELNTLGQKLMTAFSAFFLGASFCGPSRIRRSGYNVLRNCSTETERVEWLSGCAFAVRRSVFNQGFCFKREFIRWSLGEDAYFSYQVYKAHPGTLWYLPALRFKHHQSTASRLTGVQIIRMKVIYRYIFWRHEIYGRSPILDTVSFVWGQLGLIFLELVKSHAHPRTVGALWNTYLYVIKNLRSLQFETVDYNRFIIEG